LFNITSNSSNYHPVVLLPPTQPPPAPAAAAAAVWGVVFYLTPHTYTKAAHVIISIMIWTKAVAKLPSLFNITSSGNNYHAVVLLPPTQPPPAPAPAAAAAAAAAVWGVVFYLTPHTYTKAAHVIISITILTKAAYHTIVVLPPQPPTPPTPPTPTPPAAAAAAWGVIFYHHISTLELPM
jgi:hypothetical protein